MFNRNAELVVPTTDNGSSTSTSARPTQMAAGPKDKTGFVWLAEDMLFITDAGAAYDWTTVGSQFIGIGPRLEDVVAHLQIRNPTSALFKVAVKGQYSLDGVAWTDFGTLLLNDATTESYTISLPYTTRGNFGIRIRFQIGVKDNGAVERGMVSLGIALNFLS